MELGKLIRPVHRSYAAGNDEAAFRQWTMPPSLEHTTDAVEVVAQVTSSQPYLLRNSNMQTDVVDYKAIQRKPGDCLNYDNNPYVYRKYLNNIHKYYTNNEQNKKEDLHMESFFKTKTNHYIEDSLEIDTNSTYTESSSDFKNKEKNNFYKQIINSESSDMSLVLPQIIERFGHKLNPYLNSHEKINKNNTIIDEEITNNIYTKMESRNTYKDKSIHDYNKFDDVTGSQNQYETYEITSTRNEEKYHKIKCSSYDRSVLKEKNSFKRKWPGVREKPPQIVEKRNARERRRVQAVNSAFLRLKKAVPIENNRGKRISKVKTLMKAIEYINALQELLMQDQSHINLNFQMSFDF